MATDTFEDACAAHDCLKPRWKEGWCAAHWYAHRTRMLLHAKAGDEPDSLAICEAIWNAS